MLGKFWKICTNIEIVEHSLELSARGGGREDRLPAIQQGGVPLLQRHCEALPQVAGGDPLVHGWIILQGVREPTLGVRISTRNKPIIFTQKTTNFRP